MPDDDEDENQDEDEGEGEKDGDEKGCDDAELGIGIFTNCFHPNALRVFFVDPAKASYCGLGLGETMSHGMSAL